MMQPSYRKTATQYSIILNPFQGAHWDRADLHYLPNSNSYVKLYSGFNIHFLRMGNVYCYTHEIHRNASF